MFAIKKSKHFYFRLDLSLTCCMTNTLWPVPSEWEKSLILWEQYLIACNKRPRTVETRIRAMRNFAREINEIPQNVTEDDIFSWAGRKQWAAETRHSKYVTLRSFYEWYARKNELADPTLYLPSIHRACPPPRPIPEFLYEQSLSDTNSRRTLLILRLAGNLGLRVDEICRANIEDIMPDLLGYSLRVTGKGGVVRYLPLPTTMHRDLIAAADPVTGFVFPGKINGHLSARWVGKIGAQALPGEWTLHTLRHRFGTISYRQDHDLLTVQRLLGHLQVSTTQRYVEPAKEAMRSTILAISI